MLIQGVQSSFFSLVDLTGKSAQLMCLPMLATTIQWMDKIQKEVSSPAGTLQIFWLNALFSPIAFRIYLGISRWLEGSFLVFSKKCSRNYGTISIALCSSLWLPSIGNVPSYIPELVRCQAIECFLVLRMLT